MRNKKIIVIIILLHLSSFVFPQNEAKNVFIFNPVNKKFENIINLIELKDTNALQILDTNKIKSFTISYHRSIDFENWILLYKPNKKHKNKLPILNYNPIEKLSFDDIYSLLFDTVSIHSYDSFPDGLWYYYKYRKEKKEWKLSYIKEVDNYFLINVSTSFDEEGRVYNRSYYSNGFIDSSIITSCKNDLYIREVYQPGKSFIKYSYIYKKGKLVSFYNTELGLGIDFFDNGMIQKYYQINKYGKTDGNYYVLNELGEIICQGVYAHGQGVSTTCDD